MPLEPALRRPFALAAIVVGLLAGGCRQDMHDQAVVEPFEASRMFADGTGSRPLPEGSIARGLLQADTEYWAGLDSEGRPVTEIPVALDRDLLLRGRGRYDAFCSPCHDRTGAGRGMIVRRGFKQPSSFHEDRLRKQPVGYFFTVISNGFGEMSSYASQIQPRDRWAIIAYLRALQWSRAAPLSQLPSDVRTPLEASLQDTAPAPAMEHPAE